MEHGKRFHAIMQLVDFKRHYNQTWFAIWLDQVSAVGETHKMYMGDFLKLLRNKETEWAGPLLIDGLWEHRLKNGRHVIVLVQPSQL